MERLLKYRFIILAILMLLSGFILGNFVGFAKNTGIIEKNNTIDVATQANKDSQGTRTVEKFANPAILYFYSKDCSSCEKFKPNWQYLKKKYNKQFEFIEIDVDDPRMLRLNFEFMINIIPAVYIEDAHFRNRVYVNPVMYHIMPRFEDELNRYLEMREILKRGDNL